MMVSGVAWVAAALTLACVSAALTMAAGHRASSMRVIAHAAHELRGALSAADLCLTCLSRLHNGPIDLHRWAQDMRTQLERAAWAADDLDRLRGVCVAVPAGPIELDALVRRRVRAWARLAALSKAHLRLDWTVGTVCVAGNARSLCQALDNLVSNAIKHGGGKVRVWAELGPGVVRVHVDDGGPGPGRESSRRLGSLSSRHGHGLAIAKRAIEDCGGELDLGRRGVTVELPLRSLEGDGPERLGKGTAQRIGDRAASAA